MKGQEYNKGGYCKAGFPGLQPAIIIAVLYSFIHCHQGNMSGLNNMIAKFNAKAQSHLDSQEQNPFSGSFSGKKLNTRPGQENYGRPVAGSKTEKRGFQAKSHINKETFELCETIYELACYNLELMKREQEENADFDEVMIDDGPVVVTFGDLFEVYTRINNKVVGLLLAAKKKGLVFFEKEMLFQRRDDDELIMLNKPIKEIRQIMKEARAQSPVKSISPCDSDDESN